MVATNLSTFPTHLVKQKLWNIVDWFIEVSLSYSKLVLKWDDFLQAYTFQMLSNISLMTEIGLTVSVAARFGAQL